MAEIGTAENDTAEVDTAEIGTAEIDTAEIDTAEVEDEVYAHSYGLHALGGLHSSIVSVVRSACLSFPGSRGTERAE